jgi:hypothetical protein
LKSAFSAVLRRPTNKDSCGAKPPHNPELN